MPPTTRRRTTGTRKTTPPQAAAAPPDGPDVLDLDELEYTGEQTTPFQVRAGGKLYLFKGPEHLDWQDVLEARGNPARLVALVLDEPDRTAFFSIRMPAWKLEKLLDGYYDHFRMPPPPESNALPQS